MSKIFSRATLQLSLPKSSPLLCGIIYFLLTLLLVVALAEIVARSPLGNHLPAPSAQADSFLFDAKVYELEQQVRRDGRLDCAFIGSSVTNTGIDPQTVERVYREQTGETLHCFNIGYPAMNIQNAAAFTDAVIAKFHPRVVIYTFIPRDLIDVTYTVDFLEKSPWFQTQPSDLHAWLTDHSYAYRYFQTWRYLLIGPNRTKRLSEIENLTDKGFQPALNIRKPYPEKISLSADELRNLWQTEVARQGLEQLLSRQQNGVHFLLVEGAIYRDSNSTALWQAYESDYILPLLQLTQAHNIPYLRSNEITVTIPKDHWYDYFHFNNLGAQMFSEWLGKALAAHRDLFQ